MMQPIWKTLRRQLLVTTLVLGGTSALDVAIAAPETRPPQVVCRGVKSVWVMVAGLEATTTESTDVFEFVGNDLFITASDRPRRRYNSVQSAGFLDEGRFLSGHFTLLFGRDGRSLSLVLTSPVTVRITSARCEPLPKGKR